MRTLKAAAAAEAEKMKRKMRKKTKTSSISKAQNARLREYKKKTHRKMRNAGNIQYTYSTNCAR